MSNQAGSRPSWSNRYVFILAAAGSAIGLGNLWKFPYVAGENGGGAFVLVYLLCIALVGLPILLAELYIGQQSQSNAVSAFEKLDKKNSKWQIAGWMGVAAAFLILSFYSVVGGWVLDFEFRSLQFQFNKLTNEEVQGVLPSLFANPLRQLFWHSIFMLLTIGIVLGGIKNGLEKWNKILMPTLLTILAGLFFYSVFQPGFSQAFSFLFSFDFSKLNAASVLEAVGHSFFTLSLGMGAIITYGSFLSKKEKLPRIAITIAFLDTAIALVAGLVIFSIVFTHSMEPSAGPGLMFISLPVLFTQIPGGGFVSIFFFLLVSFAALTSAVSILEVVVAFVEEKYGISHNKVVWGSGAIIYVMGILTVLSTNHLSEFLIAGRTFFDLFDLIASSYLLPIGGLIISLFFGWKLGGPALKQILGSDTSLAAKGLLFVARFVAPFAVFLVILNIVLSTVFSKSLLQVLGVAS